MWAIFNTSVFTLSIARIATFEFCLGHPSMRNLLALGFDDLLNAYGKDLTISANFGPVIVPSYCSQRTTPLPYDIATMKFTLILPSFFPFAVQLILPVFSTLKLQVRVLGHKGYFCTGIPFHPNKTISLFSRTRHPIFAF